MKVSIVIPVVNESAQVRLAIERAWKSGADEVIVVDGGSDDDTREIAATENCRLVVSAVAGRALQMNQGANCATGEVLVFLHADNWLSGNACSQIRNAIGAERDDGGSEFGAFRQRIDHPKMIFRWIESGNLLRVKWQGLIYGDQALFVRKRLFDELGGFPEIALMEDFAFSKTLRRTGKPVILEGPTFVSARRWEATGPFRQTLNNWFLAIAFRFGVSPEWIAKRYRRHDR